MREPPKDDRPPLGRSPQPESLPPTADWAEVESLLHLALEKEPDEIEAFLAEACLGRPELHAEVASLIGAYHQPPNLLQRETLVEPFSMAPGFSRGQRVGPYRILEAIGRGGMGTVFLAERDHEDFSQKVALKVVELRSPRLSQRLASEGRILAGLSHPNIAQFFDVGIAPSGIPFLAMEWVPGQDLLTYCDQRRADLDERLDLFETICGAVIYAHRNLVVHRDLKPSNIQVNPDGVVKLLDFGVAKLLAEEGADDEDVTRVEQRFLTLECSAPEMMAGERSSTSADVYSLGVLLYRLLCGHRPFDLRGLGVDGARKRICEGGLIPPSAQPASVEHCAARDTTPSRLKRTLAGDLDTIAATALQPDLERRYDSVQNLVQDIRLHRQRRPIRARRDSWTYRAGTVLRRHWVAGLTAAVVIGSLVVGAWVSIQGRRAAERQARKAELVSELLLDLFQLSEPSQSSGRTIDAVDLLDGGVRRVEERFGDRTDLQVELFRVLGGGYTRLGRFEAAQEQLEKSVALGGLVDGDDDADPRQRERLLLELAELARLSARFDDAERYYFRHLELVDRRDPRSREAAESHNGLGVLYRAQGRYDEARDRLGRALRLLRNLEPAPEIEVEIGRNLSNLALVHSRLGDLEVAESLLSESINVLTRSLGTDHSYVASALTNLAVLLRRSGDLERAEPHYRQALDIRRRLHSGDHPAVAQSLNNFGAFWYHRGDLDQAEALYAEAFAMWQKTVEPGHPDMAATLLNLSAVRARQLDFGEAARGYRQALAWQQELLGSEHPDLAHTLLQLARIQVQTGEEEEARDRAGRAVEMFEGVLGSDHRRTLGARSTLVEIFVALGQCSEARTELAKLERAGADGAESQSARTALQSC